MANLLRRLTGTEERQSLPLNFQEWANFFTYNGNQYPIDGYRQTLLGESQEFGGDYAGMSSGAYRGNPIVFACCTIRSLLFTELRFQWQRLQNGRPGGYFGTPDLAILEQPWPYGSTSELLAKMILYNDIGGNAYVVRDGPQLQVLRPDWVGIFLASRTGREEWVAGDSDTVVAGYVYWPGGPSSGREPMTYAPFEVAHFAPQQDPQAFYRGMSWLTPVIREIQADTMMTEHKKMFLRNGATVNLIVKFETPKQEDFDRAVARFREQHEGYANAYKTLMLGAGTDVTPVGTNLQQMDFSTTQGSGELRIALAARVPAVMLGAREGLQGSALNSGNFDSNRRMIADTLILPLWRFACQALQTLVTVPGGARLWYDPRDVPFLREDQKDVAAVQQGQAAAYSSFVLAGAEPQSVIDYLAADDITLVKPLEGVQTVQVQPGGPTTNGSGNGSNPMVPSQSAGT